MVYYNEFDAKKCAWLRELIKAGAIADGIVDERSIVDVRPGDLDGFIQCHFFAGIGIWSYALRLAGWPDDKPAWTLSCPCQPFSAAGKKKGIADRRHLFPECFRLIRERRPVVCFGKNIAVGSTCGKVGLMADGQNEIHEVAGVSPPSQKLRLALGRSAKIIGLLAAWGIVLYLLSRPRHPARAYAFGIAKELLHSYYTYLGFGVSTLWAIVNEIGKVHDQWLLGGGIVRPIGRGIIHSLRSFMWIIFIGSLWMALMIGRKEYVKVFSDLNTATIENASLKNKTDTYAVTIEFMKEVLNDPKAGKVMYPISNWGFVVDGFKSLPRGCRVRIRAIDRDKFRDLLTFMINRSDPNHCTIIDSERYNWPDPKPTPGVFVYGGTSTLALQLRLWGLKVEGRPLPNDGVISIDVSPWGSPWR